jgi:hypothetical protein
LISIPPEDENFLRLNFYSKVRWRVPIDPTKHYFDSKFASTTTVDSQAEWRKNLAAARWDQKVVSNTLTPSALRP